MTDIMTQEERLIDLIHFLANEEDGLKSIVIPKEETARKRLLRALMNIRPPRPVPEGFLEVQDAYLQEECARKGIISLSDLSPMQPGIYLWQGDITRLSVDAIVNAANSAMLGCFIPSHGCIDNAIHSAAGVELRLECAHIMEEEHAMRKGYFMEAGHFMRKEHSMEDGHSAGKEHSMEDGHSAGKEYSMEDGHSAGKGHSMGNGHSMEEEHFVEEEHSIGEEHFNTPAKNARITSAYNLPCRYILHTVGPIISGKVTKEDCGQLAACYRSCLELAAEHQLKSIAFCCISTGEFHFPNEQAARIAVRTVAEYQKENQNGLDVVFNVFQDYDYEIYRRLLG